MRITARRVRDEKGLRPLVEGIFHDEMRAQALGGSEENIWKNLNLGTFFSSTLIELAEQGPYSLLASRLMSIEHYPPETKVLATNKQGVRIIEIRGKQFASKGFMVYQRNQRR